MQYQQVSQASPTTETAGSDIVTLINDYCDTDYTSYTPARKVLHVNVGYEKLIGKILEADGDWQWDDTNYTDLPRGTGTLVEGQETYSFSSEYLNIQMVEILDNASPAQYYKLKPLDSLDLGDQSPEEYFGITSSGNAQTGRPEYYDKLGDTLILYPAPTSSSVTLASGLRVWFQRTADLFTVSDTTQEPGIPSPYHYLLAVWASIPYNMKFHQDRVAWAKNEWNEGVENIITFFGKREKDKRKRITTKSVKHR